MIINRRGGATIADKVPTEYASYAVAAEALVTAQGGSYDDILILENSSYIAIGFLTSGFEIQTYNSTTTEYTASGFWYAQYDKTEEEWTLYDYTETTSAGSSFLNNGVFTNTEIVYDSEVIFPVAKVEIQTFAFIEVVSLIGDVITCSDGVTTLTSDDTGHYVFDIPNAGTWTLTDGLTIKTATISNKGQKEVVSLLDIATWAGGSDAEIAAIVQALDVGALSIADTGWAVGDERSVNLSAGSDLPAQTVTLALMDSGHFDLTTPTVAGRTKDHFVVGMKDVINHSTGYKLDSTVWANGGWYVWSRRSWLNNTFYNSLPTGLKPIFKKFVVKASRLQYGEIETTNDYFSLFAEKEVFGGTSVSFSSESILSQIQYYTTPANRIKYKNGSACSWWLRSAHKSSSYHGVYVTSSGGRDYFSNSGFGNVSPFGCI